MNIPFISEAVMGWLILWAFIWAVVCAVIAPSRNRSAVAWFVIGFLLPLPGLVILLALPPLSLEPEQRLSDPPLEWPPLKLSATKDCPSCGRDIPASWSRCLHCKAELTQPETKICPRCAETVKAAALVCRFCEHEFSTAMVPVASQ